MDNTFRSLIDSAKETLILIPAKASFDEVASGLSIYMSLLTSGKRAVVCSSAEMTAEFSRLVAVNKISKSVGNKNMVIKFKDYDPTSVDKVGWEVENNQVVLTIIPVSEKEPPTLDQMEVNYSGVSSDLIIVVGGQNDSSFPELSQKEFLGRRTIHIGVKLLEIFGESEVLSFARLSSSVSEVSYSLLKESQLNIDPDIATNLVLGIEEGSGSFQSDGVTVSTFEAFAELLKLGGQRSKKINPQSFPVGSIPTKPFTKKQDLTKVYQPVMKQDEKASTMTPEEAEEELQQDIPSSWSEPKIFTGTSVS